MKIKGGRAPKKENQGGSGCFGEQARTPLIFFNTTPTPLDFHFCVFFLNHFGKFGAGAQPGLGPRHEPKGPEQEHQKGLGHR